MRIKVIVKKVHGLNLDCLADNEIYITVPDLASFIEILHEAKAVAAIKMLQRFPGCTDLDIDICIPEKVQIKNYADVEAAANDKGRDY
jgi:hypothetical protein